ncbi:hypothetical protein DERF_009886 [Dermatophagoides farinae]|uniref:Uncharacterized protein n=1 Tax=Dermatophagoides farinae TaxID=6954 RepID=A0A922HVV5_DERFA|nr:hypothetical protein DERF_009886 [Dermatophagoides farinae]
MTKREYCQQQIKLWPTWQDTRTPYTSVHLNPNNTSVAQSREFSVQAPALGTTKRDIEFVRMTLEEVAPLVTLLMSLPKTNHSSLEVVLLYKMKVLDVQGLLDSETFTPPL